jgi:hypothetical protein
MFHVCRYTQRRFISSPVDVIGRIDRLDPVSYAARCMAMGTREPEQGALWVATSDLPKSPGHPLDARLNGLLDAHGFDRCVEYLCRRFYDR